jgi:hypothetical protein
MMYLSPLTANVEDESQKYYRVPIYQEGDIHTVFVGDNFVRKFTSDTLPDFLALKLSMIKASAKPELLIDDTLTEHDNPSFAIMLYSMLPFEGFETIGWQLSKRYMVVILTETQLEELKGDTRS